MTSNNNNKYNRNETAAEDTTNIRVNGKYNTNYETVTMMTTLLDQILGDGGVGGKCVNDFFRLH